MDIKNKFFYLITSITIILFPLNTHAQSGWNILPSGISQSIYGVFFVNVNTGWVSSGGSVATILKTTNGGINWISQFSTGNIVLFSESFIDVNTGWIVGGNASGTILKTTNSGVNWTNQNSGLNEVVTAVQFIDQLNGWCVSFWGNILKTTNGGTNWIIQSQYHLNYQLNTVCFINTNTGWIGGSDFNDNGVIFKTTNAGANWTAQAPGAPALINAIKFTDQFNGCAVGRAGILRKTTNGGTTWLNIASGTSLDLNYVFFINGNTGWITVNNGTIMKTTNGGFNWDNQSTGISSSLYPVFFVDNNTGYSTGLNGIILKTTNGGNPIGIKPISSEVPSHFSLYQNYPNPFNPATKIKFFIPVIPLSRGVPEGRGVSTSLKIFDIIGCEVTTLVNEVLSPGTYEVEWSAVNYPSGIYFYKLETQSFSETKRMVLIK